MAAILSSMGGAANTIQRVATGISTFGVSEIPGNVGKGARNLAAFNPVGSAAYGAAAATRAGAGAKTIADAPRDAARMGAAQDREKQRQAAELTAELQRQPKRVASDDFAARKAKMLQNMRLGLSSTITRGTGGAPAPSLSAPSLQGKNTLGT